MGYDISIHYTNIGGCPLQKISKAERLKRLSTPMDTSHAKARGSSTVSPKINTILATGIRPTGGSAGWGDMKRAVPSNIINHHHQLVTSGMLPTRLCDVMCISILSQFNIAMESHHQYIYMCVCNRQKLDEIRTGHLYHSKVLGCPATIDH